MEKEMAKIMGESDQPTGHGGDVYRALGRIEGKLERIEGDLHGFNKDTSARLDGIDARLRHVEQKSAVAGAVTGAIVSVAVTIAGFLLTGGR
jgi:phage shock protein A